MDDRCIQGLESLPVAVRGGVLTIGNFDGVHLGHQRILATARGMADAYGTAVVVLTFDPPPDLVLRPGDVPRRITPHAERCRLLRAAGADWIVTLKSEPNLLSMGPDGFVKEIILSRFAPAHVVEGRDFFFGHQRCGTVQTLEDWGRQAGFGMHVVEAVVLDFPEGPSRISSSLIRRFITAGRVADAHRCLGREFALFGKVISGQGQGRVLTFPTANIEPSEQVVPTDGIYAGRAEVGGRHTPAAISIGNKPTLGPVPASVVEAFLLELDAGVDCYGQEMKLSFVARLRDQRKFASVEELRRPDRKGRRACPPIVPVKFPAGVLERLRAAGKLLVVTHARPDGDALGSLRALTLAARAAGKAAWMLMPDRVPMRYAFLFADEVPAGVDRFTELAERAERVVILDTSVFGQLDGLERQIPAVADKLIVIDHHATPGAVGGLLWNDPSAAACGVMIAELIEELGWPRDAIGG